MAETIEVFTSPDGKARVEIVRRADGLYEFSGEAEREIDGYTGWVPDGGSGLYGSAAVATREAAAQLPWLARLLRSNSGGSAA